jgi:hypothetical protein
MEAKRVKELTPPPPGGDAEQEEELLRKIAERVVRMGLAIPAVFFLESSKPLSFIGSQALVFFEPFVKAFLNLKSYDRFASMMEERKNVERLIRVIEEMEDDRAKADSDAKKAARAAKKAEREARGEKGDRERRWWFRRKT